MSVLYLCESNTMSHKSSSQYSNSQSTETSKKTMFQNILSKPGRINQVSNGGLINYLVLENFKICPCTIKTQHNHKQCQYYHYPKDRKRQGNFYSTEICPFIEKNISCLKGDLCTKSHSCVEQLYRTEKYKMKFCSHFPNSLEKCEYGAFCSFAHSESEILIELLHRMEKNEEFFMFKFKTVMCPFTSLNHDKAQCVYYHNWQDFRRKPNEFNYSAIPCTHWKFADFILNYNDGCIYGANCDKCHGWKEFDYHPLVYKTRACPNGAVCHRIFECPYYHINESIRIVNKLVLMSIFKYGPRNLLSIPEKKMENKKNYFQSQEEVSNFKNIVLEEFHEINEVSEKDINSSMKNSLKSSSASNKSNKELLFSETITFEKYYPELLINRNVKTEELLNKKNDQMNKLENESKLKKLKKTISWNPFTKKDKEIIRKISLFAGNSSSTKTNSASENDDS